MCTHLAVLISQRKPSRKPSGQGVPRRGIPSVNPLGLSDEALAYLRLRRGFGCFALYQNHQARLLRRFPKETPLRGTSEAESERESLAGGFNSVFSWEIKTAKYISETSL